MPTPATRPIPPLLDPELIVATRTAAQAYRQHLAEAERHERDGFTVLAFQSAGKAKGLVQSWGLRGIDLTEVQL